MFEHIGQVAFRVGLPKTSSIHLVFHVCLMHEALKPTDQLSSTLPIDANQFDVPMQVLDRYRKSKSNRVVEQVLVHWSSEALADSWKDLDELHLHFTCVVAWGQAELQGEGGVSTSPTGGPQA